MRKKIKFVDVRSILVIILALIMLLTVGAVNREVEKYEKEIYRLQTELRVANDMLEKSLFNTELLNKEIERLREEAGE